MKKILFILGIVFLIIFIYQCYKLGYMLNIENNLSCHGMLRKDI